MSRSTKLKILSALLAATGITILCIWPPWETTIVLGFLFLGAGIIVSWEAA